MRRGWVQRAQSRKRGPEGGENLSPPPLAQGKRVNVTPHHALSVMTTVLPVRPTVY